MAVLVEQGQSQFSPEVLEWSTETVAVFRGVQDQENVVAHEGDFHPEPLVVVDTDVAPADIHANTYDDRNESRLALQDRIDTIPSDHPFMQQEVHKLKSADLLLAIAQGKIELPREELMQTIYGVSAEPVPQNMVLNQFWSIREYLRPLGYTNAAGHSLSRTSSRAFEKSQKLHNAEEIERVVWESYRWAGELVARDRDLPDSFHSFEPIVKEDERPYLAYVMTNPETGKLEMALNTHPRYNHTRGSKKANTTHEVGHLITDLTWADEIAAGQMLPSAGIMTVYGPDTFQNEVIANLLVQVCLKAENGKPGEHLDYYALQDLLGTMVMHNLDYKAHTLPPQVASKAAAAYASKWLPTNSEATLLKSAESRRQHAIDYMCFGIDGRIAQLLYKSGIRDQESAYQQEILDELLSGPKTPEQVIALFE